MATDSDEMQVCFNNHEDGLYIHNMKTHEEWKVETQHEVREWGLHVTFFKSWGEKWWGISWQPTFKVKRYLNYHPVAGGSGHHNNTYIRHRKGLR